METGGVAGLCMYGDFLGESPAWRPLRRIWSTFYRGAAKKMWAIGGDWDGCCVLPRGMNGIEDMEKLRSCCSGETTPNG
jgi:membrane dipeptidase